MVDLEFCLAYSFVIYVVDLVFLLANYFDLNGGLGFRSSMGAPIHGIKIEFGIEQYGCV